MIFCINGYGIPRDILTDGNYDRYLIKCVGCIRKAQPEGRPTVYLAGGATDPSRPRLTEAAEMRRWFTANGADYDFRLLPFHKTLHGNLLALLTELGTDTPFTYFCEHARRDRTRFLVWKMFRKGTVVPIAFDSGERRWSRLAQAPRTAKCVYDAYVPFVQSRIIWPLQRIPGQLLHAAFRRPLRR